MAIMSGVGLVAVQLVALSSEENLLGFVWAREVSNEGVIEDWEVGVGSSGWMSGFGWVLIDNCS